MARVLVCLQVFRPSPLMRDVILRKLYGIGFADGGLRGDLSRSKSHSIERVLVVRQTRTRADVHSVWLGQNWLATQTSSTIVASTCGNALRRAFCRFHRLRN
ncbi:hypothetical protein RE6C_03178 [Rhodopirellula europaea 6C]|uniref:Uncharacterized protein n=1 Tax=Rhodopirellula europaea 6C TaxID=1263867 RepID=M2AG45_9BACT|nr:hypothetical protein RE6C_03178 [Rhodopirellula europaea 6C]